ncbi:MAG: PHP domain-containing protein [Xanthomonadaceae bacterium]|nr:PHP domain-containing protein [Rhodospirillaceae bacterium]NIA17722.1 PHP domain-containing protein [Xanthomonadaceae bacterium]
MPYIDLQFHSTYSDGSLTPTELAQFLAKYNVKIAALTDHNTVAGIDEFFVACKKFKIKPITGIEIYARYNSERLNLLFYNFDKNNPELHNFLRRTQIQRKRNVLRALKYWQEKRFNINIDRILEQYNKYLPINGIIRQIRKNPINEKKIKEDLKMNNPHEGEIIKYYFKTRNRYYLPETRVDVRRLVKLHKQVGGKVILAHPAKNGVKRKLINKLLKEKVIDGIEILSPHHTWDIISYYQHISLNFNIIFTGGSDFHGYSKYPQAIDCSWRYFKIDSKFLPNIHKIIG